MGNKRLSMAGNPKRGCPLFFWVEKKQAGSWWNRPVVFWMERGSEFDLVGAECTVIVHAATLG